MVTDIYLEEVRKAASLIRSLGYKTYTHDGAWKRGYHYFYFTDGKRVAYFQSSNGGCTFTALCVPSKETGSGTRVEGPMVFTKERIEEVLDVRYGRPWKDFEEFRRYEEKWSPLVEII